MKNFWYRNYKYIPRSYRKDILAIGWESLEIVQKIVILEKYPELSPHFDAKQFSNQEAVYLLIKQPSLFSYFENIKLSDYEIVILLKIRPDLHTYFNLQKLNEYCIATLLESQPKMISLFKDLKIMNPYILVEFPSVRNLLAKQNV